jgi:hypothetical protein
MLFDDLLTLFLQSRPKVRIDCAPPTSLSIFRHPGELSEIGACAGDLRSQTDPESAAVSANPLESPNPLCARFSHLLPRSDRPQGNSQPTLGISIILCSAKRWRRQTRCKESRPALKRAFEPGGAGLVAGWRHFLDDLMICRTTATCPHRSTGGRFGWERTSRARRVRSSIAARCERFFSIRHLPARCTSVQCFWCLRPSTSSTSWT